MAEREGFEPSVRVTAHPRSRRAPSTTQTSLRVRQLIHYIPSNKKCQYQILKKCNFLQKILHPATNNILPWILTAGYDR